MTTKNSMQEMCRTCMKFLSKAKHNKDDKKQSIEEVPIGCQKGKSIMELLQTLQPEIKVEYEDHLPTLICSNCIQKLLVSHEFIEMYKNVDSKFRKMLNGIDIDNCNYGFNEFETKLDFGADEHAVETKYEIEIEQINIEALEKGEPTRNNLAEYEDDAILSERTENKEHNFLNAYSDDSEWTSAVNCQKVSSNTRNSKYEVIDNTQISASTKISIKKNSKKEKVNEEEYTFPIQNEDGSVPCQQCKSVLTSLKLWNEHMMQHQTKKRKYTKKSNKAIKKPSNLKQLECEHCGKGFTKMSCYNSHIQAHARKLKIGVQSYLCIECGKSFTNISGLNTHMLRHKGEKTFQCAHCPKKFVCYSGLYGHMMVHNKEKTFVCDICGSAFHMAYQLRKHNLYHNNIKNYQCEYCDMKFVTREKQRRHMRTHTGEKPYTCKYCERAFAQSNDCIKHLRQHLGDNIYPCELCPLRFPLARDLRAHFATHKDDDEEARVRNLEARRVEEQNLQIKLGCKEL